MNDFEKAINEKLGDSWYNILKNEIKKEYFIKLALWVADRRKSATIYPDSEDIFKAFKLCSFDNTKVVILGQDPYYDGYADGLAFSYKGGLRPGGKEKSLDIIFKEIENDIKFGLYLDYDYDLKWLAEQGVLLLNTILTVQKNNPNSHAGKGWENFTGRVIYELLNDKTSKVFMLWGSYAINAFSKIMKYFNADTKYHLVLEAKHPASDLYNRDNLGNCKVDYPNTFLGCQHFSRCNDFLKQNYRKEITW